ncbi:hypothetical protein P4O66_001178 [Electrophorus voltai]|uniref:Uncharacterized protein n=1 Tax=Electrophorus voltai TaxID=2609070 RepID=A0AAD8Z9R4_9TELE|nr:hypothetical protein P4O66_001178 [Electrophorus voltai]
MQTPTRGESAAGGFWGGPEFDPGSDSAESYRPTSDYRDWYNGVQYSESDSAGFYDPTMDYHKGYMNSEKKGEYNDISLRSNFVSDREEDPSMEVEEALHRDPLSYSDIADSESDEPPAPKAPPKAPPRVCLSGVSKMPRVTCKEASSSEEDTPPPKANSPRTYVHTPKPHRGKKAAAVPALETVKTAGVLPDTHVPKPEQPPLPKPAKDNPPQAGWSPTQPTTGGLAGVPSPVSVFQPSVCPWQRDQQIKASVPPSLGAEAGESYGTTFGDWDWYNDFQSSESDSYYPAERPSLILTSLQGSTRREEPAEQFWGTLCMAQGQTLLSPMETSQTKRIGTRRWTLLGPTTPAWVIIGATLIMERKGSLATVYVPVSVHVLVPVLPPVACSGWNAGSRALVGDGPVTYTVSIEFLCWKSLIYIQYSIIRGVGGLATLTPLNHVIKEMLLTCFSSARYVKQMPMPSDIKSIFIL